jgi:cytochrome c-type protein NapB
LLLTGVIGLALVGYFVGINDGAPQQDYGRPADQTRDVLPAGTDDDASTSAAIPAASYSEMRRMETGPTSRWEPSLERIHSGTEYQRCITCHNPHSAEITPNEKDKLRSLSTRAARRAFNGAPPVIPHPVERTNDAACYACHGEGARVGDRVANRMSHGPLVNCLQCHTAPPPKPFAHLDAVAANTFVGLAAPISGQRAFPGAPPVIPHSTWMRERCLSCHGGEAGWPGLEVTHRWRTNCTQCHASSSKLDQAEVNDTIHFVPAMAAPQP